MVFKMIRNLCSWGKLLLEKAIYTFGVLLVIIASSVCLCGIMYNLLLPDYSINGVLNFVFNNCEGRKCDYPVANASTSIIGFNYARGEDYEFLVDLVVPESKANMDVGMFIIKMEFQSLEMKNDTTKLFTFMEAKKSTMLKYKSPIIQLISSVMYSPFIVHDIFEEVQTLSTTVTSNYKKMSDFPLFGVKVTIESLDLNFYRAILTVRAKFEGIRYYMIHYPILSLFTGFPLIMPGIIILILFRNYLIHDALKTRGLIVSPTRGDRKKRGSYRNSRRNSNNVLDGGKRKPLTSEEKTPDVEDLGPRLNDARTNKLSKESNCLEIESPTAGAVVVGEPFDIDDDDEGSIEVLTTPDTTYNRTTSTECDSNEDEKTFDIEDLSESFEIEKIEQGNY